MSQMSHSMTPRMIDLLMLFHTRLVPDIGCPLLPPANVVCEGYVFSHVCHSVHRGACVVAPGGCMVALGGMHGCSGGLGHVWFL